MHRHRGTAHEDVFDPLPVEAREDPQRFVEIHGSPYFTSSTGHRTTMAMR